MFTKIFKFSDFFYHLVKFNFCWIVGLLLGGIILGIYPSSIALYWSIEKFVEREEVSVKEFFQVYFQVFKSANQQNFLSLFLIIALLSERLLINNKILNMFSLLSLVLLYLVFIYSVKNFQSDKKNQFRNAVEKLATQPIENLTLLTLALVLFRLSLLVKGSVLVLSISLFVYAHIKIKKILENSVDKK